MKQEQEIKGYAYEDANRQDRVLISKAPDQGWNQSGLMYAPGAGHDVWKRYTESRLRSFGSR